MKTWISLLLFIALAQCPAADPLATLTELRAALREELKSALDKGNIENNQRLYQLESLLVESLPDKEMPDEKMPQTIQALLQVRSISRDKKVTELAEKLVDEMRTQARAAAKRLQESFTTTLARCLRDGFKAAKPGELDAPLKELAGLKRQIAMMQNRNSDMQMAFNSQGLQTIEGLLNIYQDLLFSAEKGTTNTNTTQRLSGDYSYRELNDIIPRSEFLELVNTALARLPDGKGKIVALTQAEYEQTSADLVAGIKRLADIEAGIKQLEVLETQQRRAGGYAGDSTVLSDLRMIANHYVNIRGGAATMLDTSLFSQRPRSDPTAYLKNMLVRFVISRAIEIEFLKGMKADETVGEFLSRALPDAIERRDWLALARILDLSAQVPGTQNPFSTSDSSALRSLLAAQNQEQAHQYQAAVASYLYMLRTGSQNIPLSFISERLDAIKKVHLEDYRWGVELANSPLLDRYASFSRSGIYPPGFPPSRGIQLQPAIPASKPAITAPSKVESPNTKLPKPSPKSPEAPAPEEKPDRAKP